MRLRNIRCAAGQVEQRMGNQTSSGPMASLVSHVTQRLRCAVAAHAATRPEYSRCVLLSPSRHNTHLQHPESLPNGSQVLVTVWFGPSGISGVDSGQGKTVLLSPLHPYRLCGSTRPLPRDRSGRNMQLAIKPHPVLPVIRIGGRIPPSTQGEI